MVIFPYKENTYFMTGLGTIINTVAIIVGGIIGHFTGKLFEQEQQAAIHIYEKCGYKEIDRPKEVVHSTMNRFFLKFLKPIDIVGL